MVSRNSGTANARSASAAQMASTGKRSNCANSASICAASIAGSESPSQVLLTHGGDTSAEGNPAESLHAKRGYPWSRGLPAGAGERERIPQRNAFASCCLVSQAASQIEELTPVRGGFPAIGTAVAGLWEAI